MLLSSSRMSGLTMCQFPNRAHRVRVVGDGAAMMVIPGGPGWFARYMIESLVGLLGVGHRLISRTSVAQVSLRLKPVA